MTSGPGYTTGNDAPFVTESLTHYPRNGKTYAPHSSSPAKSQSRDESTRRVRANADVEYPVRPRNGESDLGQVDGRRFRRTLRRLRSRKAGSEESAEETMDTPADESGIAGCAGEGFSEEQLQRATPDSHDPEVEHVPAFVEVSRRVEGRLHPLLRAHATFAC